MSKVHLHLVSDATGDTVRAVARACLAQFEGIEASEHFWVLVRGSGQMERVIEGVGRNPGIVLCTVVDTELRSLLESACRRLAIPYVPLLDATISAIGSYLGVESKGLPGRQHEMDAAYFDRIEAMDFALAHDDGQSLSTIEQADIVLVGVSRTSKTPTCVYLAHRGLKAANIPFVPGVPLPTELANLRRPLVVGLTVDPTRLIQIRRNRLLSISEDRETNYVDPEVVEGEVVDARRYFLAKKWPVINVTRRSVEETAAAIMQMYSDKMGKDGGLDA